MSLTIILSSGPGTSDTKTNYAAIIDPAWDLKEVYSYISKNNLKLKNILLTHSHNDHVNAIDEILLKFDLSIYLNHKEKIFWNEICYIRFIYAI